MLSCNEARSYGCVHKMRPHFEAVLGTMKGDAWIFHMLPEQYVWLRGREKSKAACSFRLSSLEVLRQ